MMTYIGWVKSGWGKSAGASLVVASLFSAFGSPAFAQTGPGAYASGQGMLAARDILSIVSEQGFEPLSQPVRQGGRYVLVAVDEVRGIEMRLVVDGWTGDVLRARPRGFDPPGSVRTGYSDLPLPRANGADRNSSDPGISGRGLQSGELGRRAALPPAQAKPGTPTPRPRPAQPSGEANAGAAPDAARTLAPTETLKPIEAAPQAEGASKANQAGASGDDKPGQGSVLPPVAPLE